MQKELKATINVRILLGVHRMLAGEAQQTGPDHGEKSSEESAE